MKCTGLFLILVLATPSAFATAFDQLHKWVQDNAETYQPGDSIDVTQFLEIALGPGQIEDPSSHYRHERATVISYDGSTMVYKNRTGIVKTISKNPEEDYPGQHKKVFTFRSPEVGRVHVSKEVRQQARTKWTGGWLGLTNGKPYEVILRTGDVSTDLMTRMLSSKVVVDGMYAVGTIYFRSSAGELWVDDSPNSDDLDEYRFRTPRKSFAQATCGSHLY